jgi:CRISPR/Cas system CMR subunit Cmr4 (Cas7 group RAMP superfamily)
MKERGGNPIIKRIAVKADCEFASPALIGSGFGENTDNDILRDASGKPFLPGSTIAGVLRSMLTGAKDENMLFGAGDRISPLWVLDSELAGEIIELDGVALDAENKVALEKKKYDYEAISTGSTFTLRLLLTIRENDIGSDFEDLLKNVIGAVKSPALAFGAKTRRGFGQVKCNSVVCREFNLTPGKTDVLDEWLSFDWKSETGFTDAKYEEYTGDKANLTVKLKLDGSSIMIRDTRNIYEGLRDGENEPDYKHISIGERPVILGTSWAGAIRSGLWRLLNSRDELKANLKAYLDKVFGYVTEDDKEAQVSLVSFSASTLEATYKKIDGYRSITRVKIDRFTGGAADGALFNEKPWYGGKTTLEILYPKERRDIEEMLTLALEAIDKGLIQIGGENAIGRGFFKVLSVNGKTLGELTNVPKQNLIAAIRKAGATK